MNASLLATTLRVRAGALRERDETDAGRDDAELIRVLARVLEGQPLANAFGAPGSWGYGTPIGDALAAAGEPGQVGLAVGAAEC